MKPIFEGKIKILENEIQLTKAIRKYLDMLGIWNWKPMQGLGAVKGIPDIICCWKGRFIAIEVKVGSNKPSKYQECKIKEINRAGGLAFVAYSIDDVINKLDVGNKFIGVK